MNLWKKNKSGGITLPTSNYTAKLHTNYTTTTATYKLYSKATVSKYYGIGTKTHTWINGTE